VPNCTPHADPEDEPRPKRTCQICRADKKRRSCKRDNAGRAMTVVALAIKLLCIVLHQHETLVTKPVTSVYAALTDVIDRLRGH
jgi:hypothetical protein